MLRKGIIQQHYFFYLFEFFILSDIIKFGLPDIHFKKLQV